MMNFYTNVAQIKGKICVRAIENGARKSYKVDYRPSLFIPAKGKKTEFHTLQGEPVERIHFENSWEMREWTKRYEDVANFKWYGLNQPVYTFINENSPGEIKYDITQIHKLILDIEVDSENGYGNIETADKEVIAICMRMNKKNLVFGCKPYKAGPDTTYILCKDEKELLTLFLTAWNDKEWEPDVVTGWNVNGYDIPYLVTRIRRVLGEEAVRMLSPWRVILSHDYSGMFGKKQIEWELVGISVVDGLQLYKKFSYTPRESYRLDYIAQEEIKAKKVDYSKYGSLNNLYKENYQLFIDYNIHDTVLVEGIEEKKSFLAQAIAIAYDSKINYVDSFTTVKLWDVVIHNHLYAQKIVIPGRNKNDAYGDTITGAYVKEPILGMHDWVVNFDLNSLYPHLIMQYNLSPETLCDTIDGIDVDSVLSGVLTGHKAFERNVTVAAGGCVFTKDFQGFLPKLMSKMYDDRLVWKKRMIEAKKKLEHDKNNKALINEVDTAKNMQMALKIKLNGGYGALCNAGFRWFDRKLGEAITLTGQVAIKWVEKKINDFLNKELGTDAYDYVVASDTDSLYVRLGNLVGLKGPDPSKRVDFLDKYSETVLQPKFKEWFQELADYVHAYEQKMVMKREYIAEKGIWTGKKHYILNVWDTEGVRHDTPEIKITGLESVKSSTPTVCRKMIKEAIKVIMNKKQEDLWKFIADFKQEFSLYPIEDVAFPRSCNGLLEYAHPGSIYKKATPIAPKGALIYNYWLRQKNLTEKYELIKEGEKIKFVYLKLPNPIRDKVISFINTPPPELGIAKYVDYDIMYEKGFLNPIHNITKYIGWTTEKINTLDALFE